MENTARISFSAITHIGAACTVNDDRIYANGRFMQAYDAECSRISLEASGSQFIFALSDGMDTGASGISVLEDLKKLHDKVKNSSREIHVKLDELAECVDQSNNLLFSMALGEEDDKLRKPAFAGIIIDNGGIAAVNMGGCRIYKLDGDNFKLMVNDYKRTERLLKMGIINDEQAELLSGKYKASGNDGKASVKKSDIYALKEDTVYLICSRGLIDSVNEDAIYDILASGAETDVIADRLVKEALQNEAGDNVTAMVLRVEKVEGEAFQGTNPRSIPTRNISGRINRLSRNVKKRKLDVTRLVSTFVLFVVIAAFIFGAITIFLNTRNLNEKDAAAEGSGTLVSDTSTAIPGLNPDEDYAQTGGEGDTTTDNTDGISGGDTDNDEDIALGEDTTYTVKPGDSLMKISEKFYGDRSKYTLIMKANDITDPDKITVDQVLKIPAAE